MNGSRGSQPTILDVAARAGVSKSAVSRVLSGTGRFSDETRERVERAAAELGYVANAMARGLVSGRTNTIGMLVRDASSMVYTALHAVMERRASELGYRVVTTTGVGRVEDEKSALAALVSMRVDGLVVCSGLMPSADIAEFAPRIATVVAGRPELHPALSSVYCDEVDGGASIADAVADAGHTTAVVFTVPLDNAITQHARSSAMLERLRARGVRVIDIDASFVRPPDDLAADLVDAVQESGVTAVMCPTDRLMLDVCEALALRGVEVPRDLSVTGFDGVYPLASDWIGFTTLQQPIERIGREAIDLVIGRIDDPTRPVEHRSLRGTVIPGRTLLPR
ncbi:LacI family DNA-binding transcriptional regulator [Curtobacterium flaccumfaciens]|uniref:LacI family DNA-binding transcriptional regulator n=1 Tax=Curtobacterium flaccumfaciens TaxID=2035 RepID=UPI00188D3345|nr:LacI family DNA-binding transcriptional regulator [Curtobacterium flaccumfaciens]MBF4627427.1 LacI family DNA-binding transcriptional regulator [Curtobacterium flaccumfaciens]